MAKVSQVSSHNPADIPPEINQTNWRKTALRIAGIALIVIGTAAAVAVGIFAFQATISIGTATLIAFTLKPFLIALGIFITGMFSGTGCLAMSNKVTKN